VLSEATYNGLSTPIAAEALPPAMVKGRDTPVAAFKLLADAWRTEEG
jgi:class 3 adenylate cyclase